LRQPEFQNRAASSGARGFDLVTFFHTSTRARARRRRCSRHGKASRFAPNAPEGIRVSVSAAAVIAPLDRPDRSPRRPEMCSPSDAELCEFFVNELEHSRTREPGYFVSSNRLYDDCFLGSLDPNLFIHSTRRPNSTIDSREIALTKSKLWAECPTLAYLSVHLYAHARLPRADSRLGRACPLSSVGSPPRKQAAAEIARSLALNGPIGWPLCPISPPMTFAVVECVDGEPRIHHSRESTARA
jgi:hypothetical protein